MYGKMQRGQVLAEGARQILAPADRVRGAAIIWSWQGLPRVREMRETRKGTGWAAGDGRSTTGRAVVDGRMLRRVNSHWWEEPAAAGREARFVQMIYRHGLRLVVDRDFLPGALSNMHIINMWVCIIILMRITQGEGGQFLTTPKGKLKHTKTMSLAASVVRVDAGCAMVQRLRNRTAVMTWTRLLRVLVGLRVRGLLLMRRGRKGTRKSTFWIWMMMMRKRKRKRTNM
jgi:hypothetical protein